MSIIDKITQKSFPVDCGRCYQCVKKRISQWSFRLRKEGDSSLSSFFVTLTYDTEHVPLTKAGYMTLDPQDVTLWLKRLRKLHDKKKQPGKIKYFYVGEYGGKTMRPHYHIIIFNANREDIEATWTYGKPFYGTVTGASIGYSLKYICKDGKIPMHKNDDRLPEFGRMSKGLGAAYLTDQVKSWHGDKNNLLDRSVCTIDGKKVPMPKYYKSRIYDEQAKYILKHQASILQDELYLRQQKLIDVKRQIEAHKAEQAKLLINKHKNKFL